MINSRKQVIAQLAIMENKLKYHQDRMKAHRHYLVDWIGKSTLTLIYTLLPAFIIGWKAEKIRRSEHAMKRLIKFGMLKAVSWIH